MLLVKPLNSFEQFQNKQFTLTKLESLHYMICALENPDAIAKAITIALKCESHISTANSQIPNTELQTTMKSMQFEYIQLLEKYQKTNIERLPIEIAIEISQLREQIYMSNLNNRYVNNREIFPVNSEDEEQNISR